MKILKRRAADQNPKKSPERLSWEAEVRRFKESLILGCRYVKKCQSDSEARHRRAQATDILGDGFVARSTLGVYVILERLPSNKIDIPTWQSSDLLWSYCDALYEKTSEKEN